MLTDVYLPLFENREPRKLYEMDSAGEIGRSFLA